MARAAIALAIAACSPQHASSLPGAADANVRRTATPITHVVFVIQENRSFNNLFMGYPGAKTAKHGYDETGAKIELQPIDLATGWDIDHSSRAFFTDCDGAGSVPGTHCKMDGWNNEFAGIGHPVNFAYGYVPRKQIEPYWEMAKAYVLADRMFASNLDGSFIAHQYVVAAYASDAVDFPITSWGCWGGKTDTISTLTQARAYGPSIRACFENPTIAERADAAGLSWRFYAGAIHDNDGLWSSYQADRKIFKGPDWSTDVVSPPAQFLTDVAGGYLANVTWIAPTLTTSDHPGLNAGGGPAWVASVVNAVGESPYWDSTAIFIIWDDWGGWFDPVKPVYEDYDGLGFRVPMLIVSAYARQHYVTHVQYETSSVLRFIEDNFGLAPLAKSDERANDPADDAFDFDAPPRAFQKIRGGKSARYWMQLERAPERRGRANVIGDD
ncbi:MAG TPA: alkaline phosphatase family protein [Candidatus Binatia bacterium]|nr:alkaline phosphatase family protein [Candidatus Binatia bacterium]